MIPADRRAFLHLAQREKSTPETADFFAFLAEGEAMAGERLIARRGTDGRSTGVDVQLRGMGRLLRDDRGCAARALRGELLVHAQ